VPPNQAATAQGYHNLWNRAAVRTARIPSAFSAAQKIKANKSIYLECVNGTLVPWQFVGLIHCRESDFNFKATFCDGEPIIGTGRKTRMVPVGRGPYATFQESVIDELKRRGLHLITVWSVERLLFETEALNGWGYLGKCNSPYDWGATTCYGPPEEAGGKYTEDHVFSKNVIDTQLGCAAILKELATIDLETTAMLQLRQPVAPHGVVAKKAKEATAKTRKVAQGAGGAVVVGGANEAGKATTTLPDHNFIPSLEAGLLIGVGLVIGIIATVIVNRTTTLMKGRW
jgi:lysozyme family protein